MRQVDRDIGVAGSPREGIRVTPRPHARPEKKLLENALDDEKLGSISKLLQLFLSCIFAVRCCVQVSLLWVSKARTET